jgi:hypothetical protein
MTRPVVAAWSGVGLGGDLEPRLLGRPGEAALDALLHARDQDRVAEVLPAGLRVVHGEDGPAVGGRPGGVVGLAAGSVPSLGCTAATVASYCSLVPPLNWWMMA